MNTRIERLKSQESALLLSRLFYIYKPQLPPSLGSLQLGPTHARATMGASLPVAVTPPHRTGGKGVIAGVLQRGLDYQQNEMNLFVFNRYTSQY